MATKTLRPLATTLAKSPTRQFLQHQQRRTFLPNPFNNTPQTLVASRTLPYPSTVIYEVISDISSYHQFIPYCQSSTVTKTSNPAPDGKTYPEHADLVVGFNNDVSETFTSRVHCVPQRIVEAISGSAETSLLSDEIAHHNPRPTDQSSDPSRKGNVLTHLSTRWTLNPFPYKPAPTSANSPETTHMNHKETSPLLGQEKTEVNLAIEFQFANPIYAALSAAAAPKVADKMIEAFEKRVKAVLHGPASVNDKPQEGVLRSR